MTKNLKNIICRYFFRKKHWNNCMYICFENDTAFLKVKKNKEFRIFTTAEQNLCISTILWNLVQSQGSMFLDYKNFAVLIVYKTMLFNVLNKNVTQLITLLIFVGKHSKNTLNIKSNIVLIHVHIHIQNSLYMIDILNP